MTTQWAFTGYLRRSDCDLLGANLVAKVWGRHWVHRSERVRGALDEFVSEFGFGRRQPRDSGATNLLRGSLIKARCRLVSWE